MFLITKFTSVILCYLVAILRRRKIPFLTFVVLDVLPYLDLSSERVLTS
jgi:hypothetical protein